MKINQLIENNRANEVEDELEQFKLKFGDTTYRGLFKSFKLLSKNPKAEREGAFYVT